tara:strand:+ start:4777 stop:5697 length:921 start_codon:yes stop_codon:yes gene_type:complete
METEAQSAPAPAPEPTLGETSQQASEVEQVQEAPQTPESFNIFSDEPSPAIAESNKAEPDDRPKKSKQFLENLKRDKQLRQQEIALKQRHQEIAQKEQQLAQLQQSQQHLKNNPDEFFKSQGIDPMEYYRTWTERLINTDGEPSLERQLEGTREEVEKLREKILSKEEQEKQAIAARKQTTAYNTLCSQVEQYASSNDGYDAIKESCTAKDIVNGMVQHFKSTGEELTIEEAFEKIETGLRKREEDFYKDPKVIAKLQRYNPEALKTSRGPQATLSARFKEQPTRTDPTDMPYEEIRDYWKGKLFT